MNSKIVRRKIVMSARPAILLLPLVLVACSNEEGLSATNDSQLLTVPSQNASQPVAADTSEGTVETDVSAQTSNDTSPQRNVSPSVERLMYVSVSGQKAVRVAKLEPDGQITLVPEMDLQTTGSPGAMVLSQTNSELFVGVANTVTQIKLAPDGTQSVSKSIDTLSQPVYLDLSADEQQVVTAYFGEQTVAAGPIDGDDLNNTSSAVEPHAAKFNPDHSLVYVPHRKGDKISWFSLADGKLNPQGEVAVDAGLGPRHIVFSANGQFAYVVNEFADSVSAFSVDDTGSLTLQQTISALPEGFDGQQNTGADIHLSLDGKYLYSSNRGHDSIAQFRVNPGNGELTANGHTLTLQRPREFSVSPDGRFVVVAGQDSASIASYQILGDGKLSKLDEETVGDGPVWVAITG